MSDKIKSSKWERCAFVVVILGYLLLFGLCTARFAGAHEDDCIKHKGISQTEETKVYNCWTEAFGVKVHCDGDKCYSYFYDGNYFHVADLDNPACAGWKKYVEECINEARD
jgi:hypothetical protein